MELDHKESWVPKNWCFWTVVLEKTLKSPLDCKEIQPVHPKGNQSWIFIGRTDAEAEVPILWPPDVKSWFTGKGPDAEKIEGSRRRGQQRMRWLGSITDSTDMNLSKFWEMMKKRKSLVWCGSWCCRGLGMTYRLNNHNLKGWWALGDSETAWKLCALSPHLAWAYLASGCSWVISFYNKPVI